MRCLVFLQWGLCVSCEEGSGDFLRWIWTISYYIICLHFKFQFLKHILLSFQCYHVNIVFSWCVCVVGHYHCVIEMIAFTFTAWSVWSVLPCSWGAVENSRYVWSQFKCHVFFQTIGRLLTVQIFLSQISPVYWIPETPVQRPNRLPTEHSIPAVNNRI